MVKILRPVSRFGRKKSGGRAEMKARVIERLRAFFDRFFDIAPRGDDGRVEIG